MANGSYEIDEQTFKSWSLKEQNWIQYKTFNAQRVFCDKRFCKIERKKWLHLGAQCLSGIVGGALVLVGFIKWLLPTMVEIVSASMHP